MAFINWMISNWQALLSIIAMLLAVGVSISHLAHNSSVATTLQSVKDAIDKINGGGNGPSQGPTP